MLAESRAGWTGALVFETPFVLDELLLAFDGPRVESSLVFIKPFADA